MKFKMVQSSFVILIFLSITTMTTYTQTITPVPIVTPVSGQYVFQGDQKTAPLGAAFSLLDTFTGEWRMLLSNQGGAVSNPIWDNTGQFIAFSWRFYPSAIVDVNTGQVQTSEPHEIVKTVYFPYGLSPDRNKILNKTLALDNGRHDRLQILDITSNVETTIFDFREGDPVPLNWPLPPNVIQATFFSLDEAAWNPVYPEWIAFRATLINENPTSGSNGIFVVALHNYVTGQFLSIDQLINYDGGFMTDWSEDGKYLAINAQDGAAIVEFIVTGDQVETAVVVSGIETQGQVITDWLGVEDLLLTGTLEGNDRVHYIAQIINGEWHSTEFFRFPSDAFNVRSEDDWYLTADDIEKRSLSCIFDQTLETRLAVGNIGRVAINDGTPRELRSAPGTDEEIIAQMSEGTQFDVIGEPWCANGYRWWQIQLADDRIGYTAEANSSIYFIEPFEDGVAHCSGATIGLDWIVFSSKRNGDTKSKLYAMPPGGGTPVKLTVESGGQDFNYRRPAWSPDKTMVSFGSDRGQTANDDIWIMYLDTCEYKQATTSNNLWEGRSTWAANGSAMAFVRLGSQGQYNIWKIDVPARATPFGSATQLTTENGTHPSWSPTTNEILFTSNRLGTPDIWVMNHNGNNQRVVYRDDAYVDQDADWSSDGWYIAFTSNRGGNDEIYRVQVERQNNSPTGIVLENGWSGRSRLTVHSSADEFVAWSPDGGEVVFVSDRAGNDDIFIMPAFSGATTPTNLTSDNTGQDTEPNW